MESHELTEPWWLKDLNVLALGLWLKSLALLRVVNLHQIWLFISMLCVCISILALQGEIEYIPCHISWVFCASQWRWWSHRWPSRDLLEWAQCGSLSLYLSTKWHTCSNPMIGVSAVVSGLSRWRIRLLQTFPQEVKGRMSHHKLHKKINMRSYFGNCISPALKILFMKGLIIWW